MRNRTLVTAVIVAVMAMSLYITGCGGGGGKSVSDVTNTTNTTTTPGAAVVTFTNTNPDQITAASTGAGSSTATDTTPVTTFADGSAPSLATFLDMATCNTCHAEIYSSYLETNHNLAWTKKAVTVNQSTGKTTFGYYKDSYNKTYCVNCHAVNTAFYDADGDSAYDAGEQGAFGLTPVTYADYTAVPAEYQGIQCENCHGPASLHGAAATTKIVGKQKSFAAATCMYCHGQYEEWTKSSHGVSASADSNVKFTLPSGEELSHPLSGYTRGSSTGKGGCGGCHTGEGFVNVIRDGKEPTDYCGTGYTGANKTADCVNYSSTTTHADGTLGIGAGHGITCATCHDPHAKGDGESQLRVNKADLCGKCHNARYRKYVSSGVTRYDKVPGSGRGPHLAAQREFVTGGQGVEGGTVKPMTGTPSAYQYGYSNATNTANLFVKYTWISTGPSMGATTCVDCHMYSYTSSDRSTIWTGHTFKAQTEACNKCHSSMNAASVISAKQTRFEEKLEDIHHRLGNLLNSLVTTADTAGESGTCAEEVEGRCCVQITTGSVTRDTCSLIEFNFRLLEADVSKGVHNEPYVNETYTVTDEMLKSLGY